MPPAAFEPANPASEQSQTDALDLAAIAISMFTNSFLLSEYIKCLLKRSGNWSNGLQYRKKWKLNHNFAVLSYKKRKQARGFYLQKVWSTAQRKGEANFYKQQ
jgi:hypothetical protein